MEYECSWIGQGERLVDSRRKNGASKKEDNKYIPLETMIELGLIKLVQVSAVQCSAVPYRTTSYHIISVQYRVSGISAVSTYMKLCGIKRHILAKDPIWSCSL